MTNKGGPYVARGNQAHDVYETQIFNIDNGAGTTIDDVFYCVHDTFIDSVYPVYAEATDTAGVASANWKIGTAAGGAQVVAATAYEVSKAVGAAGTAGVLVISFVPAGTTLFVRHTGIAATEGGQAKIRIEYHVKP